MERAGIVGAGLRHVEVGTCLPMPRRSVLQLHEFVGEPERAPVAVTVASVELPSHRSREPPLAHAGGKVELLGGERAEHSARTPRHSLLALATRDDVDRPAHGVRAVEQRRRPLHHLDALHTVGHIRVGERMSENAGPLRLPVDHEQHLVALAHAAYVDRPRASARDAVAREAAFADEQPRHLRRQHRKQRRLRGLLYLLRAYPAHVERQERRIGLGRGNHGYFGKGHCVAWRPGRRSGRARCRNGSRHEGDYWCHMRLLRSFCGDQRKTSPRFRPQKYSKIPNLHRTARITVPHSVILVSTSRQCHTVFRKPKKSTKADTTNTAAS